MLKSPDGPGDLLRRRYCHSVDIDILGPQYRRQTLRLPADREGEVTATLVRRTVTGQAPTAEWAVLYVHGFADYFFQRHLADFYIGRGIDFYAIDLRKYGRSLHRHQTANHCDDLREYYPELDRAMEIVRGVDGHRRVLLNGHSMGGLLAALWTRDRSGSSTTGTAPAAQTTVPPADALFLNSPFLDFNIPQLARIPLGATLSALGARWPLLPLPFRLPAVYASTINSEHGGAWAYDLRWKPPRAFTVHAGWVRAIRTAQRRVRSGLDIEVPILVAAAQHSASGHRWSEAARSADTVLNVADIVRWAPKLGSDVTVTRVPGGLHDLTLSNPEPRATLFAELGRWLDRLMRDPTAPPSVG